MLVYLDTNIILTRYSPDELYHEEAKRLLSEIELGKLSALTSVLTLIEVACTASRAFERYAHKKKNLGREAIAGAFLKKALKINNLRFIPIGGDVTVDADISRVEIPALFALALEIGSKTGVKTLDTLHLASAAIAARIYDEKIDRFITLDEDILRRREIIDPLIESRVTCLSENTQ